MKTIVQSLMVATSLVAATPAYAQLVNNGDGTVTITSAAPGGTAVLDFNGNSDGTIYASLTSQLSLTFDGIIDGDYTFTYSLFNNSTLDSRTSGLAFDTNPNIIGGSASGVFTNLLTSGNYPNGVGAVEVCLQAGGNSCAGGGGGGVNDGSTSLGSFSLDFGSTTPTTLTLSNFAVRYQSLDVGSGSGTGRVVPAIPEPATWAMMLVGFGGIGFSMRRRRKATARLLQVA